jgi:hypothetical protein
VVGSNRREEEGKGDEGDEGKGYQDRWQAIR